MNAHEAALRLTATSGDKVLAEKVLNYILDNISDTSTRQNYYICPLWDVIREFHIKLGYRHTGRNHQVFSDVVYKLTKLGYAIKHEYNHYDVVEDQNIYIMWGFRRSKLSIFKAAVRLVIFYNRVKRAHYAPGGNGYLLAKSEWNSGCMECSD